MSDNNIALFKLALTEGLSNRIDRQISDCTEEIVASPAHSRAMNRIVGCLAQRKLPTSPKLKKIIAILVAAVLLLTGCAVVYRQEIRSFIEEIYESFMTLSDVASTSKSCPCPIKLLVTEFAAAARAVIII